MKIGILCDFSESSGFGHINRCFALSKELQLLGCECFFILDSKFKKLSEKIEIESTVLYTDTNPNFIQLNLIEVIYDNKIDILIIDSYSYDYEFEFLIKSKGIFVASIDDHLKRHDGNIVFNNRSAPIYRRIDNPRSAIWLIGNQYILSRKSHTNLVKSKKTRKPKKVLLHAGGSSAYESIIPLVYETLLAVKSHQLKVDIICTNLSSKKLIEKILLELEAWQYSCVIPHVTNLSEKLTNYDIVVGPAGTTTFECLFAETLPISVPLSNDGRDDPESWPYLGHMLHLNYREAQQRHVIQQLWEYAIASFEKLMNNLKNYYSIYDNDGAYVVASTILEYYEHSKNPSRSNENNNLDAQFLSSKPCKLEDARIFLEARNQDLVRKNSSNPDHIITWPEHLNWWSRDDIFRFGLWKENQIIAFHWSKLIEDREGTFVVSGWMPVEDFANKFEIAAWLIQHQIEQVKKQFVGELWLISMNKQNVVAKFLNKRGGFVAASSKSVERAAKAFNVDPERFDFMEMNL